MHKRPGGGTRVPWLPGPSNPSLSHCGQNDHAVSCMIPVRFQFENAVFISVSGVALLLNLTENDAVIPSDVRIGNGGTASWPP